MIKPTIHCDGPNCTRTRGPANKWIIAIKLSNGIAIYEWIDALAEGENSLHYCSEQCLHRGSLGPFLAARSSQ